jgi:hypothetical protein
MSLQRNVEKQNDVMKAQILRAADRFRREDKYTAWLVGYLLSKGIDPKCGLLVSLTSIPDQAGDLIKGIWVTSSREFWEVEGVVERDSGEIIEVERFENITSLVAIDGHLKGAGKSFGYLAIEVLNEALEN